MTVAAGPAQASYLQRGPGWSPTSIGRSCVPAKPYSLYTNCFFTANRKDSFLITGVAGDTEAGAAALAAQFCLAAGFDKNRASKALDWDFGAAATAGSFRVGVRSLYCEDAK